LENVIRYNSFSTTVVASASATTDWVAALAEPGPAVTAEAGEGEGEGEGASATFDAELEATWAGVSGCVFFFGAKYCRPRKMRTKTIEKMRSVRESCPPPPG
jgi:hypothetical protein